MGPHPVDCYTSKSQVTERTALVRLPCAWGVATRHPTRHRPHRSPQPCPQQPAHRTHANSLSVDTAEPLRSQGPMFVLLQLSLASTLYPDHLSHRVYRNSKSTIVKPPQMHMNHPRMASVSTCKPARVTHTVRGVVDPRGWQPLTVCGCDVHVLRRP